MKSLSGLSEEIEEKKVNQPKIQIDCLVLPPMIRHSVHWEWVGLSGEGI